MKFSTDVYDGEIDTRGGTLAKLTLKKEGDGKQPDLFVTLFDHTKDHTYLARTGVTGGNFPNHNDLYTPAAGNPSALAAGQDSMKLSFESQEKGGVKVVKTYTFTRGSYVIGVDTKIENVGTAPVTPTVYMEIVRDSTPVETPLFSHTFLGPAVYTDQKHFQKITFSDIDKNKAEYINSADNGWVAMVQHYFASAWIPQQGVKRDIYVEKIDPSLYRVGVKEQVKTIEPGQSADVSARLFAGPEEERVLEGIAPGLDLVKDYGWVTIIAKPLFWLLQKIHGYVGNWGWSIVLLTLLIKAVFFPLSAASYKSMARMKEITPRMQALRERFKSDPQKMNAALMELYKTEKVNPFGGCLPVVIQIPVFISLYWVLLASVEMRARALDSLDPRSVAARSVLHPAGADGRFDVPADAPEPDAAGPGPGQDDDVHADRVLGDVLLLPGRPGAVLRGQQRAVDRAAVLHHAHHRQEEGGQLIELETACAGCMKKNRPV